MALDNAFPIYTGTIVKLLIDANQQQTYFRAFTPPFPADDKELPMLSFLQAHRYLPNC